MWKTAKSIPAGFIACLFIMSVAAPVTWRKYDGSPVNRPPWLGYDMPSLLQKSGVSVEYEHTSTSSTAMAFSSLVSIHAAAPEPAVYSSMS